MTFIEILEDRFNDENIKSLAIELNIVIAQLQLSKDNPLVLSVQTSLINLASIIRTAPDREFSEFIKTKVLEMLHNT